VREVFELRRDDLRSFFSNVVIVGLASSPEACGLPLLEPCVAAPSSGTGVQELLAEPAMAAVR